MITNVPIGVENDARAPWNRFEYPARKFDCVVDYAVSKNVEVWTKDYDGDFDPDYGFVPDVDTIDFNTAYEESCFTLPELLGKLADYVREDIRRNEGNGYRVECLRKILDACEGWEIVDVNVSLTK